MLRSLRGRLILLLVLLVGAALATGILMVGLFHQSAAAQQGQAAAENSRACDAIAAAYRANYGASSGVFGAPNTAHPDAKIRDVALDGPEGAALRERLSALLANALRTRPGVQGGVWSGATGSLAYAYPTYVGAVQRTDPPAGELPRIRALNAAALANDRTTSMRYSGQTQTLLLAACPLPGPIPHLTAWTMSWTLTFAGRSYHQLMAGLGVLLVTVLAAAALLTHLTITWSRHVSQIESALNAYDVAELPVLPATRERELDRIVLALNEAARRLAAARQRADTLARQMATAERMAAIGRVAAGVAHEIRNPIAAMRLKAESAVAAGPERQPQALHVILGQIERLDALVRRLLSITEHDEPKRERVALAPFLDACLAQNADEASAKQVTMTRTGDLREARFDPDQMQRALDNLILNAIHAAPPGSRIEVAARNEPEGAVLAVHDEGTGPPAAILDHLFEPFVTGRPDGTGLGLSIVREVAEAHGGAARFTHSERGTTFEMVLPWPTS
ncbi:sensor histidine kinase [Paraburkholderia pallida]|uniref:histidine kinase n=1 Tax=Paraburkholderia pallida TaxID=2547399 RepID=A0A4V1AZY7_9BURK|nr:HAMP domain-containing sensor histidine kinase [Paraburkholderia pallida]QBR00913.1 HAMP domain-containing histidine kinase [Paraburkholderia pallida]